MERKQGILRLLLLELAILSRVLQVLEKKPSPGHVIYTKIISKEIIDTLSSSCT